MTSTTRRTDGSDLAPGQRTAKGRALRKELPREALADLRLDERPDPVALLVDQGASRVQELLPLRYGRMSADPFAFLRGSAAVMAQDLAATADTGLRVQLCGDAHLSNFGVFATPERRLVFDLNDFDETAPGPFEWDVKRLAASVEVAGRVNGHSRRERRTAVLSTVASYRTAMRDFAQRDDLSVWYTSLAVSDILAGLWDRMDKTSRARSTAAARKARSRDNLNAAQKLTVPDTAGQARFAHRPPVLVPLAHLLDLPDPEAVRKALHEVFRAYRRTLQNDRKHLLEQFHLVDVARKVVGVGSVGTRAYLLLLLSRGRDPLVLQIKEAGPSVLEPYVPKLTTRTSGQRVVDGQRLLQAASDIFLGWYRQPRHDGVTRDFYLRQLRDGKGSAEITGMPPKALTTHAALCAWTLARAHARSGDRIAIAAYLGGKPVFDEAMADWAAAYADRTEADHGLLLQAVKEGRLTAVTE